MYFDAHLTLLSKNFTRIARCARPRFQVIDNYQFVTFGLVWV